MHVSLRIGESGEVVSTMLDHNRMLSKVMHNHMHVILNGLVKFIRNHASICHERESLLKNKRKMRYLSSK